MKFILAISLLLCLSLSYEVNASCSGDCPETEDVVWALGGGCSVFRNKCFFDKANCTRRPALQIVTKEECQKHCASACPQNYDPVSGDYKGQIRHFGNACEKIVHSCQTGETFLN
ncbi:uncharacterized protein LOC117574651 [Drosophila albomicans]|uniref:Uncharacterized protein LOC117574651 n=1 Tax=Drosophila albomicans TaxID=7291 RepID=A0A6P8XDU1_DROAB|nr:uncharacterized protein LOC117574651 [Drosophila albomicans]